jgi:hypothetical protein
MNTWTIKTTSSGMSHLHNLTTGGTSSIGYRDRGAAERTLTRMVTAYPAAHQAAPGALTVAGPEDYKVGDQVCVRSDDTPTGYRDMLTADGPVPRRWKIVRMVAPKSQEPGTFGPRAELEDLDVPTPGYFVTVPLGLLVKADSLRLGWWASRPERVQRRPVIGGTIHFYGDDALDPRDLPSAERE